MFYIRENSFLIVSVNVGLYNGLLADLVTLGGRAALRLLRARVLCQMRAPYRPITRLPLRHSHQLRAPETAGPGAAAPLAPPLNAALVGGRGAVFDELTSSMHLNCICYTTVLTIA